MLMPKKVKHRKQQRGRMKGNAKGATEDPAAMDQSPAPVLGRMHVWVVDPNCDITAAVELTLAP